MLISTKGRYAIRVLCNMARNNGLNEYISLPLIAQQEDISLKYLERIMLLLVKGKLINSTHGKGGIFHYRNTRINRRNPSPC